MKFCRSFVAAVLLLAVAACGRSPEAPPEAATPATPPTVLTLSADQIAHGAVKWMAVTTSLTTDTVDVAGELKVDENRTARISAPARGRVLSIAANAGDAVRSGQTLVTMQSDEAATRRADHAKATAEVAEHEAAQSFARAARERAERLLELKAISLQDVERARTEEKTHAAALTQAQAELARAVNALATLNVAPSGHIILAAPFGGVVVSRDVVPGAVADAGTVLLVLTDPSTLWLESAVSDQIAETIRAGTPLRFSVSSLGGLGGAAFSARVRSVAGTVDPATRLVAVTAVVDNRGGRLRPAMLATVRINTGAPRSVVLLPDDAVQLMDEKSVVFTVEPGANGAIRVSRRDVETGPSADGRVQIVRGLSGGDRVVTEGAFAVKAAFVLAKSPS